MNDIPPNVIQLRIMEQLLLQYGYPYVKQDRDAVYEDMARASNLRDFHVTRDDINTRRHKISEASWRYHSSDQESIRRWVATHRDIVFVYNEQGSEHGFALGMWTPFMRDSLAVHGHGKPFHMDATHSTNNKKVGYACRTVGWLSLYDDVHTPWALKPRCRTDARTYHLVERFLATPTASAQLSGHLSACPAVPGLPGSKA